MIGYSHQLKLIGLWIAIFLLLFVSIVEAQESTPQPSILQIESESASAIAWSPDGTMLAVGNSTGIRLYTENLEFLRYFEQFSENMKALEWSPDGRYFAALGADDIAPVSNSDLNQPKVYVWEVSTGKLVTIFADHAFLVTSLSWSPDSMRIATGSWDNSVKVWNPLTATVLQSFSTLSEERFAHEVQSLDWSPDGKQLATVALGAGIYIWDVDTGSLTEFIPNPHPYPPIPLVAAWSPEGDMLATGSGILDVMTLEGSIFERCSSSGSVDWHPNRLVLAQFGNLGVIICDIASDEVLASLEIDLGTKRALIGWQDSLDWHPDGQRLAIAAGDDFVRIWHVFNNQ